MSFTKNVTEILRVAPDFQVWLYSLPASLLTSVNLLKSVVLAIVQTELKVCSHLLNVPEIFSILTIFQMVGLFCVFIALWHLKDAKC